MVKANVANFILENSCKLHCVLTLQFGKCCSFSSVTEDRNGYFSKMQWRTHKKCEDVRFGKNWVCVAVSYLEVKLRIMPIRLGVIKGTAGLLSFIPGHKECETKNNFYCTAAEQRHLESTWADILPNSFLYFLKEPETQPKEILHRGSILTCCISPGYCCEQPTWPGPWARQVCIRTEKNAAAFEQQLQPDSVLAGMPEVKSDKYWKAELCYQHALVPFICGEWSIHIFDGLRERKLNTVWYPRLLSPLRLTNRP